MRACMFQIVWFLSTIKQAHLTATSLVEALENRRKGRRFLLSLWEFFYRDDYSADDIGIEERRRVPVLLANAQQQLIDIFQVSFVSRSFGTSSLSLDTDILISRTHTTLSADQTRGYSASRYSCGPRISRQYFVDFLLPSITSMSHFLFESFIKVYIIELPIGLI